MKTVPPPSATVPSAAVNDAIEHIEAAKSELWVLVNQVRNQGKLQEADLHYVLEHLRSALFDLGDYS